MPRLTYVGHATVLLELDGARLLTDPFLRGRLMHLRRRGRTSRTGHADIDAVLLSHLHFDHCDLPSLRRLGRQCRLLVPPGAGGWLRRQGFRQVEELQVGDDVAVGPLQVTATPALHDGRRSPWGPAAEAIGFVVNGSRRVYFAGDTDVFPGMDALAGALDLALLPVWGWGPTLGPGHLTPLRAAEALTLLRPRLAVPIHWGTIAPIGLVWLRPRFLLEPPHVFARHAQELAPATRVVIVRPGHDLEW